MRDLIIWGTGPHAREMAEWAGLMNRQEPTWSLLGFASPRGASGGELDGLPVLAGAEALASHPGALVAPEYGSGPVPVAEDRLARLVAPTAFVAASARLGPGCVLYPGCFVGADAVLGRRVFCLAGCVVNHDCHLENGVTLCSGVTLAGHVHVEAGAYLGQACTVRQSLRVGRACLVGMGAVVVEDVPAEVVVAGNPAGVLTGRRPPEGANHI